MACIARIEGEQPSCAGSHRVTLLTAASCMAHCTAGTLSRPANATSEAVPRSPCSDVERAVRAAGPHHLALALPGLPRLAAGEPQAVLMGVGPQSLATSSDCCLAQAVFSGWPPPDDPLDLSPLPPSTNQLLSFNACLPSRCRCPTSAGPSWRAWRPRSSTCTSCCRCALHTACASCAAHPVLCCDVGLDLAAIAVPRLIPLPAVCPFPTEGCTSSPFQPCPPTRHCIWLVHPCHPSLQCHTVWDCLSMDPTDRDAPFRPPANLAHLTPDGAPLRSLDYLPASGRLCFLSFSSAGPTCALLGWPWSPPHPHTAFPPPVPQKCSSWQLRALPQAHCCLPPPLPAAPPALPPRCRQGWALHLPAAPAAAARSCCPQRACSSSGHTAGCPAMARPRSLLRSPASQRQSAPTAAYQTHSTPPTPPLAQAWLPRQGAPAQPAASLQLVRAAWQAEVSA